MLNECMDSGSLAASLIDRKLFRPFPRACDRSTWVKLLKSDLNRQRAGYLAGVCEEIRSQPWPLLPATLFAEFVRTGNRSNYEKPYFIRRQNLAALVLGECLEYGGRNLDAIMDGLVSILEETTWSVPAHALRHHGDLLAREDAQTIDLFACETAAMMAEALFLLEDELAALSPTLVRRIRQAVLDRIILPVEEDIDRYWWSRGANNWTPWCASNILGAAAYILEDRKRLAALIHDRLNPVLDRFLLRYPVDGCCDEGPGYWNVSPGALLVYLEHLYALTEGAFSVYKDPLIQRMGNFIANAHLTGPWALNFADAGARLTLRRPFVYRYGERTGSEPMIALTRHSMRGWTPDGAVSPLLGRKNLGSDLGLMLREFFWMPADEPAGPLTKERTVWYPHTQVLIARESEEATEGLILAAKGGHNAENHNHNDVGHFVLYSGGHPFVIDIGVGVYTAQTFSNRRYEIFTMCSRGHNVPVIGGVEQQAGAEFKAREARFTETETLRTLSLELAGAYPQEAGVHSLLRVLSLETGGGEATGVTLTDTFLLSGEKEVTLHFYTPAQVTQTKESLLLSQGTTSILVRWMPQAFERVEVEEMPLEDANLRGNWGSSLRRITCTAILGGEQKGYTLTFRRP